MTTVKFAYYLNNERHHEPLAADSRKWFSFIRSFKVSEKQVLTV